MVRNWRVTTIIIIITFQLRWVHKNNDWERQAYATKIDWVKGWKIISPRISQRDWKEQEYNWCIACWEKIKPPLLVHSVWGNCKILYWEVTGTFKCRWRISTSHRDFCFKWLYREPPQYSSSCKKYWRKGQWCYISLNFIKKHRIASNFWLRDAHKTKWY